MKPGRHRARRIRDELRLWLRSRHGFRTAYSRQQIHRGARALGLDGADDLMLAYTLFGSDLAPTSEAAAMIIDTGWFASASDESGLTLDLFAPD